MPFTEDLTVFLDEDVFASEMTWDGGNSASVIFDAEHILVNEGAEADTSTVAPTALAREADLSGLAQGDTVTIGGLNYKIVGIQPDGTGMTLLILHRTT